MPLARRYNIIIYTLAVLLKTENGFFCSGKKPRAAFYRSANSILNVIKRPSGFFIVFAFQTFFTRVMLLTIITKRKRHCMWQLMMQSVEYFLITDGRASSPSVRAFVICRSWRTLPSWRQNSNLNSLLLATIPCCVFHLRLNLILVVVECCSRVFLCSWYTNKSSYISTLRLKSWKI